MPMQATFKLTSGCKLTSGLYCLILMATLAIGATGQAPALPAAAPEQLLQQAGAALDKEAYEAAVPLLETYLAQNAADISARFNLAYSYSMTNRPVEAIEQYRKVLAAQPDLLSARMNLGMLLRQDGSNEEAIEHLRRVAAAQPDHWTALTELGHALGNLGRVPEARAAYESALKLRPENHTTRMDLAALLAQTEPAGAEAHLRIVMREMPEEQEAQLTLARLLEDRSAPATAVRDEALQLYEDFLKTNPTRTPLRLHLAELYLAEKRPAEAITHLETVRTGAARAPEANQLLLEAYLATNQKGRAEPLLIEMIAAQPNQANLHLALGSLRNEVKRYAEAAQSFARGVELDPKSSLGWTNLASALYLLKDYPRTVAALDQVAKLGADTAGTYFLRALALDQLRAQQGALDNYQKFLSLADGKNPDQQFQAKERSRVLTRELQRKGGRK